MNHTGVCGTGWRRQARRKGLSAGVVVIGASVPRAARRRASTDLSEPAGTVEADEEVAPMQASVRWCASCATETLFEQPPCEDGHGEDCLDLACVACGAALTIGVLLMTEQVVEAHRSAA
jgi:hypothetical protein